MTIRELYDRIEQMNIPSGYISLQGGFPDDAYVIRRIKKRGSAPQWEVYYSERGGKTAPVLFETEEAACDYLYARAKESEDYYRKHNIIITKKPQQQKKKKRFFGFGDR